MSVPVLVTIPISHYCEKARWALDLAGIEYVEEPHPPFFHMLRTMPSGVGRSTPQLRLADRVLPDSQSIIAYADAQRGGDFLLPRDATERADVDAWVTRFDTKLGPHVRRYAYFHLLERPALVTPLLTHGTSPLVKRSFRAAFPLARRMMERAMGIDAPRARRSEERIREELDAVGDALRDGRRYLVGGRFTSADLTFAALIGPLLAPPGHTLPLPSIERLPPAMRFEVERFREHPASAFAVRMYAEHRRTAA